MSYGDVLATLVVVLPFFAKSFGGGVLELRMSLREATMSVVVVT